MPGSLPLAGDGRPSPQPSVPVPYQHQHLAPGTWVSIDYTNQFARIISREILFARIKSLV